MLLTLLGFASFNECVGNAWRMKSTLSVPIIPMKNKDSSQTDTFLTQVSLKLNRAPDLKSAVFRWLLRSLGEQICVNINLAFREQIPDPMPNEKISTCSQAKRMAGLFLGHRSTVLILPLLQMEPTNVIDQPWAVSLLDDFQSSDTTTTIQ